MPRASSAPLPRRRALKTRAASRCLSAPCAWRLGEWRRALSACPAVVRRSDGSEDAPNIEKSLLSLGFYKALDLGKVTQARMLDALGYFHDAGEEERWGFERLEALERIERSSVPAAAVFLDPPVF